MSLKAKALNRISEEDILGLIENRVPESRDIDYKEQLPGSSDAYRREFLADISSFGNTDGGLMLYGMREGEGRPTEVVGLRGIGTCQRQWDTLRD